MKPHKRAGCFAAITAGLLLAAGLSACVPILSTDMSVTFYPQEAWAARAEVVFAPEQLALAAGQIETALDEYMAQLQATGVEAEWQRLEARDDGNVAYRITASGQGLGLLNQTFFDNLAVLYVDEGSGFIVFQYIPNASALGLGLIGQQTYTLSGGQVASSNGSPVGSGAVQWVNPRGTMEAMLTPASRAPWLPLALLGAGGLLLAGAALGLLNRARARQQPFSPGPFGPAPALAAPGRCQNCGAALPAEARFCPRCGAAR